MPKVSVIVPFYNVENYIDKCIQSIINQSLKDIEIILVNDGSEDDSEKIAKGYLEKYPDKIIYLEKENGGLGDARNYGMPYANGKYIAFVDSDDYIEPNMYEEMLKTAEQENSDMVECDFYWEYPDKLKKDVGVIYNGKKEMLEKVRVVAWNKLIRREILEKTEVKFPKGYRYEDVEFTYKLVPFIEKVSFLKKPCVHYIQREGSISNSQNERTKEIFDVLDHVIDYYKEKGIYETYQEEIEYIYVRYAFCSSLLRIVKIEDVALQEKLLNLTWEKVNTNFPNWKRNSILKKGKGLKNLYLKTINQFTYNIYTTILSIMQK